MNEDKRKVIIQFFKLIGFTDYTEESIKALSPMHHRHIARPIVYDLKDKGLSIRQIAIKLSVDINFVNYALRTRRDTR